MKIVSPRAVFGLCSMLVTSFNSGSLMASQGNASGSISTDKTMVLENSIVNVKWSARYPTSPAIPEPSPSAGLIPLKKVRADVRVIGAAFGPTSQPYPVRGWVKTSVETTSWTQIFLGNSKTCNPQTVVWSKVLAVGEKLDFKFQGALDGTYDLSKVSTISNWQKAIDTTSSSSYDWNRAVLEDGQTSPNYNPAFDQGDVHSHLATYFYPGTTKVKLGPHDFLYLTELSQFAKGHKATDMQDLVLLVTFTEITDEDEDDD